MLQDLLQAHYFEAFLHLSIRVFRFKNGALSQTVIGMDTLNEPSCGYLNHRNLMHLNNLDDMRLGPAPSPFESFLLGSGRTVRCDNWEFKEIGFVWNGWVNVNAKKVKPWRRRVYRKLRSGSGLSSEVSMPSELPGGYVPSAEVETWLTMSQVHAVTQENKSVADAETTQIEFVGWTRECAYAEHGVWDPTSLKLLQPGYFATIVDADTGNVRDYDWISDSWKPFVNSFGRTMRQARVIAKDALLDDYGKLSAQQAYEKSVGGSPWKQLSIEQRDHFERHYYQSLKEDVSFYVFVEPPVDERPPLWNLRQVAKTAAHEAVSAVRAVAKRTSELISSTTNLLAATPAEPDRGRVASPREAGNPRMEGDNSVGYLDQLQSIPEPKADGSSSTLDLSATSLVQHSLQRPAVSEPAFRLVEARSSSRPSSPKRDDKHNLHVEVRGKLVRDADVVIVTAHRRTRSSDHATASAEIQISGSTGMVRPVKRSVLSTGWVAPSSSAAASGMQGKVASALRVLTLKDTSTGPEFPSLGLPHKRHTAPVSSSATLGTAEPAYEHTKRRYSRLDIVEGLVLAPHWYDKYTNGTKHFHPSYTIDVVGWKRGEFRTIFGALALGYSAIRASFAKQLNRLFHDGVDLIGALGARKIIFGT